LKRDIKFKLNPHEEWVTQHKGIENPRTGAYWDFNKVGLYACKVCTQRIFSSTHKYPNQSGHASFWNYLPYSVNFKEDKDMIYPEPTQSVIPIFHQNRKPVRRICCSNCESHIGLVFEDGPAPFFKRLMVNSAAVKFLDLGWQQSPEDRKIIKTINWVKRTMKERNDKNKLIERKEKELEGVIKNVKENVMSFEESINNEMLVKDFEEYEEMLKGQKGKIEEKAKLEAKLEGVNREIPQNNKPEKVKDHIVKITMVNENTGEKTTITETKHDGK